MHLTDKPISVAEFLTQKPHESCGAVSSFVGIVRNHHREKRVVKLYYECYESMANKQMGLIIEEIQRKWNVSEIRVLHRTGWLEVGEVAVVISVTARHREEAFSACREVIDQIKEKVPIWKKEVYADGTNEWVLNDFCHSRESGNPASGSPIKASGMTI